MKSRVPRKLQVVLLGLVVAALSYWLEGRGTFSAEQNSGQTDVQSPVEGAKGSIQRAFEQHQSNVQVTASGVVSKVLPDDRDGSRHQRFIVKLPSGKTVLIAHNIDLAPRVPDLKAGMEVRFNGEYEWNEKGGVVHWTHRDPKGIHEGGWLEVEGKRYE